MKKKGENGGQEMGIQEEEEDEDAKQKAAEAEEKKRLEEGENRKAMDELIEDIPTNSDEFLDPSLDEESTILDRFLLQLQEGQK